MTDKRPLRRSHTDCRNAPTPLKEISLRFLFIAEHRRRKQLRGFGLMPFRKFGFVLPYDIDNIRESTRVERPTAQVADNLRFYLPDNNTSFRWEISAQIFGAER